MSAVHLSAGSLGWSRSASHPPFDTWTVPEDKRRNNSLGTSFTSGLPTPPGSKAMPGVMLGNGYSGFSAHGLPQAQGSSLDGGPTSGPQYRASSVSSKRAPYDLAATSNPPSLYSRRAADQKIVDSIAPHLQIPESVNKSKGSLAEFTAEITCLFWFETANTLQYAEDLPVDAPVDRGLVSDTVPTVGFRKWVTTIISTTQVGKNVILLALMFIYRLKRFNPTVSGKRGSEFRLLTIALMLGNKFLDDNTYTNKTWAEVSGISVTEIHIMEVEFLSNMRYALYASAAEWTEWKAKLGRFGAFYDKASKLPFSDESNGTAPTTPTSQSFSHKLPSPPSPRHVVSPFTTAPSLHNNYPKLPHPLMVSSQHPSSPLRHQHITGSQQQERKRSLDFQDQLPPAKRHYSASTPGATGSSHPNSYMSRGPRVSPTFSDSIASTNSSRTSLDVPRLDIPRIPSITPHSASQPVPLSVPSSRAMSVVYPTTATAYNQPITPMSAVPHNLFQNTSAPSLGDGRSMCNYSSVATSPSHAVGTTTPTLPGLSPSYFLTHRASPYRPVRHVNTLLIPPPSGALQMTVRNVPTNQIHYQPLSKTTAEPRTGVVPLMQPDGWSHSNVSTPIGGQQYHF